jgi:hypothetical protein
VARGIGSTGQGARLGASGTPVWQACQSWYRDDHGNDTYNWPWLMSPYWRRTRRTRQQDYSTTTIGDRQTGIPG